MNLTKEQHATIVSAGNLRIIVDGIECVLLRSDVFDRVCTVLGDSDNMPIEITMNWPELLKGSAP